MARTGSGKVRLQDRSRYTYFNSDTDYELADGGLRNTND